FEEMPDAGSAPTCDTAGVIMPIIATISAVQVTEALKILVGKTDALHRSLMQFDVWQNDWRKIKLQKPNPDCAVCGQRKFELLEAENSNSATSLCGRDAIQILPPKPTCLDLEKLADNLKNIAEVKQNEYLLRLSVEGFELTIFRDARAIIRGTDNESKARSIYAKYIGS
ncbi:MAG: thiazole biosynthesis adenylyltransferase ThiF, partial [Acidobacteriota bacterium]|nr:thiazole biosynthesis adenylyltransferase ThiF [Acidobacteriota bacterium]